jgi:hypothetical protein
LSLRLPIDTSRLRKVTVQLYESQQVCTAEEKPVPVRQLVVKRHTRGDPAATNTLTGGKISSGDGPQRMFGVSDPVSLSTDPSVRMYYERVAYGGRIINVAAMVEALPVADRDALIRARAGLGTSGYPPCFYVGNNDDPLSYVWEF